MSKKERMSQGKKNVMEEIIEMHDIKSAKDLQKALNDLLGGHYRKCLKVS